ncbi:YbaB/EbfC family nucleoid-associated protein [Microtetraspora malaysiensis]|uniref:YbaB/EbfC family nucleoid-associated protein n=1 Tax=Microtetraspora malaysiensis TaxID=161358 RepID=UPI003D8D10AA
MMRRLSDVEGELGEVRGRATDANSLITVVVDGSGRVEKIELNPRVMRLESHVLAEELVKTISEAQDDGARRTRELLSDSLGGMEIPTSGFDPARAEKRMTESYESFARAMERRIADLGTGY